MNDKRKTLKLMLSREVRRRFFRISTQAEHAKWQKENFKAYAFARSAKKIFRINTQVEHAKWQRENFKAYAFARSAKKNFWKSCRPSAKDPSFGLAKHLTLKLNMPNDKRKTLKPMLSREARRKILELAPKLNMPNDKRKTFKAYAFARSAEEIFRINTQVEHAKWQQENF